MARIGILGGGISGLAVAYFLQQAASRERISLEVTLLEKSSRLGGVIRSEEQQGCLLEWGPDAFVSYKPETFRLAERLGLSKELQPCREDRRRTYVSVNGQLRPLPDGMSFLAPVKVGAFWKTAPMTPVGRCRALLEPFISPTRGEPTVRELFEYRLGREFTNRVAEPLVSAIFGGDIDRLAAPSALPEFWSTLQSYGSFRKGLRRKGRGSVSKPLFFSFRTGMQKLVSGLVQGLTDVSICRNVSISELTSGDVSWELSGPEVRNEFDTVVLCLPAHGMVRILTGNLTELARMLEEIEYSSTRIVYLAYRKSDFSHPLDGFGFVLPKAEATVLDACTWVSSKFEDRCPADWVLLRCAIHDGRYPRQDSSPENLAGATHREVKRILGVKSQPVLQRVFDVPRSMPQFALGHASRVKGIISTLASHRRGLHLWFSVSNGVWAFRTASQPHVRLSPRSWRNYAPGEWRELSITRSLEYI